MIFDTTIILFQLACVLPFVAAAVSLLYSRTSWGHGVTQGLFVASGVAGVAAVAEFFLHGARGAVLLLPVVTLAPSPLGAFFFGMISVGTILSSVFALYYLPLYRDTYDFSWLAIAMAFFISGMQGVVLSGSVFTFLLFWEIMSVAAYFLVIADRSTESLRAGFTYFVMTHFGFVAILAGFFILSRGNLFFDWSMVSLIAHTLSPSASLCAFLLFLIGFGSKAGLVPLHQWLPHAHPQAPSHASALLSGVMLKIALFGMILSSMLFPSVPPAGALAMLFFGLLSAVKGSLFAAVERDAKRLLAYSSIENMGLIFTGVGAFLVLLDMPASALTPAMTAGLISFVLLHTVNHFLFKSGLFLSVGAVVSQTHTRNLDALGGLAGRMPYLAGIVIILALGASALPPFGTFFGEWALVQSLALGLASSSVWLALGAAFTLGIVGLVGGLALFAFVKLFSSIFLGRARTAHAQDVAPLPRGLMIAPALTAGLLALVPFSLPLVHDIASGVPSHLSLMRSADLAPGASINVLFVWALLAASLGAIAIVRRFFMAHRVRVTDTWDCGAPLSPRMEYTATGFSAPIRFFFRSLMVLTHSLATERIAEGNPWIVRAHLSWSTSALSEKWLYRPLTNGVVRAAGAVKRLQNGIIQLYLAFILLALIITLIIAL